MKTKYDMKATGGVLLVLMVLGVGCSVGPQRKSHETSVAALSNEAASAPSESTRELLSGFRYQGRPVNPAMLYIFSNWLSDTGPPNRRQINLTNCFRSNNEFDQVVEVLDDGGYKTRVDGKDDCYYQFIGNLGTNLYVVCFVQRPGGGSGAFSDLLILRASREYALVSNQWQQQIMLTCLGSIPLGDRVEWKCKLNPQERSVTVDTHSSLGNADGHHVVQIPSKVLGRTSGPYPRASGQK